jgi:hypothetical protein
MLACLIVAGALIASTILLDPQRLQGADNVTFIIDWAYGGRHASIEAEYRIAGAADGIE